MSIGLFASDPGPCPICGAKNSTCTGESQTPEVPGMKVVFDNDADTLKARFRSNRCVYRQHESGDAGRYTQVWGVGKPIPLVEAIRQGQIVWEALTPEEQDAIRAHGYQDLVDWPGYRLLDEEDL